MTLYLAVTADKYELPLYVADTCKEMAKWYGVSGQKISTAISKYQNMEKREIWKLVIQTLITILTAIGTSIGVVSCM